jgi:hypothetical protein
MKKLFTGLALSLWAGLATAADTDCRISQRSVDGVAEFALENSLVRLRFVPAHGGVCASFFDKQAGVEWTTGKGEGGLFEDHVWQQPYSKSAWRGAAYVAKVLVETPETVALELLGQGKPDGDYQFMSFRKTVTLTRDSPAVRVHYAFEVSNEAMSAKTVGLWWHGSIAVPGQKIDYFYPVDSGVRKLAYDPAMPPDEYWEYNPARGWLAAVAQSGAGLAVRMEYRRLMCFYQWFGPNLATLEWMFRNETIANGKSLETDVILLPFQGLTDVAGVGDQAVVSLAVPATGQAGSAVALQAKLALSTPLAKGQALWASRRLPDLIWKDFATRDLSGAPGTPVAVAASFTPASAGLYAIRLQVTDAKMLLVEAEKPLTVGQSEEKYVLTPESERLGDPTDRFGKLAYKSVDVEVPWTSKVVTPHVAWAKPYAKGKLKALILMHADNSREVAELAQRFDLEFDAPLIDFGTPSYVGDAYGKINPDILNDLLKKYLKKSGYDVIVVSGLNFKALDQELPGLFRAQVEKGVGVVYIAPGNFPENEAWSCLPLDLKNVVRASGGLKWHVAQDNPITAGVPVELLPATGVQGFRPSGGEVFMTAGEGKAAVPLGFLREQNGQRTVVFNYRSSRYPGYGDCLTPYIRFPKERFHYWEYELSLLGKAMLWAGHREPGVALAPTVEPPAPGFGQGPVTIQVAVSGADVPGIGAAVLECVLRDEDWTEVKRQTFELDLKAGNAAAKLVVEATLPLGTYFVDSILRCQGNSVAWGTVAFQVTGPVQIGSFRLAEEGKFYKTGEEVTVEAEIVGASAGLSLTATLTDSLGRDLVTRDFPVPAGAKTQIKVTLPVDRPLATEAVVRAVLHDPKRVIDRAEVDFVTLPDRFVSGVWDDYEIIPWGAMGGYDQGYLIPTKARLARAAGISVLYVNSDWAGAEDLRNEHESSLRAGFRLMEVGMWEGYPSGYEEDRKGYQTSGDKKYLERKPSLSDTAYLTATIEKVRKKATTFQRYQPLAWMWGDEQSVIGRITVFDYDFSPFALREFRQWLARQYGTLDTLNREWDTAYRTWDEVAPLTGTEAREKRSFASWADHRTFMETSYAEFYATLIRTVREVSPNCLTGLSGTQAPTAYNGCDWTRFMQLFTYMQPYYYQGQENMMPAFNPSLPKANWSTGYGGTDSSQTATWHCFLSGSLGTSYFALRSFFNPDFTYTQSAQAATAVTEPMRHGLGKLWSGVTPDFDPIAILYSQRSIQGAYLLNREWWHSHQAWFDALHDLGYRPRFVTTTQLDSGEIVPQRYKLLILPMTTAVSATQALQIEQFVKAGGTVVADLHSGILDGHCRLVEPATLDPLFGIQHSGFNQPGPSGTVTFTANPELGIDLAALTITTALPEGNIRLAGGQALGTIEGVPFAILGKIGTGRTCYLNLEVSKYSGLRQEVGGNFYRELVARLATWAGLKPEIAVTPSPVRFQIYRQREGQNLYVGYLRPTERTAAWSLGLGRTAHVYDTLAGTYRGEVNSIASEPAARLADLFALLPYRVTGVTVTPTKAQAQPGERVPIGLTIQTASGTPGRHAVRVSVLRPDGTESDAYTGNLALTGGKGSFELPFALNDPAGTWTLNVRDAATGAKGTATLLLKGR